jgi:large subunit ribosomal protein L23
MAQSIYDIIRRPITTEKSSLLQEQGQYVFEVARTANKIQIKEAIERTIPGNPTVVKVRIVNMHRKARNRGRWAGFTPAWKKAIVTLAPGQHIDLFEGV